MKKILAILFLLTLTLSSASAQEAVEQTFFLTYIPNVQFAPVYVALEKGYFADEGINVTIEHGDEPVGVDLIAAGQRQFGIIGGDQVIAARANERPVVFVYEWFQQFPIAIVTPDNSGIETVEDMRGRRVGVPGRFGATYSGLVAVLAANGLTEADIQLEAIGFNAPEVVCVGGVEASAVYINNEPLQIAHRAEEGDCGDVTGVNVIPVSEYADLVSNGLVTNETTIAENPELVQSMVNAFHQGTLDGIRNPAEAYLLSANYVENILPDDLRAALEALSAEQAAWLEANPDADRAAIAERRTLMLETLQESFDPDTLLQFEVLLATVALWDADQMGYTDPASWELTEDTLITMGFIPAPVEDLSAAYTNDFLPE